MNLLNSHILNLEHNIYITDSIGAHILIQEQTVLHLKLFVGKTIHFFADIGTLQHRNAFQVLRSLLRLLVSLKGFCLSYHFFQLFIGKAASVCFQPVCQLFLTLGCKTALRHKSQDRTMCIVQKPFLDQILEIAFIYCNFQLIINLQKLYLGKSILIIIKPASHNIQSIHQTFWKLSKICFAVTELHVIDSGKNRLLINSIFHNVLKAISDNGNKFLLPGSSGTFCNHGEIRLQNTVAVIAINILTDSGVQKSLLQRCSRRT